MPDLLPHSFGRVYIGWIDREDVQFHADWREVMMVTMDNDMALDVAATRRLLLRQTKYENCGG